MLDSSCAPGAGSLQLLLFLTCFFKEDGVVSAAASYCAAFAAVALRREDVALRNVWSIRPAFSCRRFALRTSCGLLSRAAGVLCVAGMRSAVPATGSLSLSCSRSSPHEATGAVNSSLHDRESYVTTSSWSSTTSSTTIPLVPFSSTSIFGGASTVVFSRKYSSSHWTPSRTFVEEAAQLLSDASPNSRLDVETTRAPGERCTITCRICSSAEASGVAPLGVTAASSKKTCFVSPGSPISFPTSGSTSPKPANTASFVDEQVWKASLFSTEPAREDDCVADSWKLRDRSDLSSSWRVSSCGIWFSPMSCFGALLHSTNTGAVSSSLAPFLLDSVAALLGDADCARQTPDPGRFVFIAGGATFPRFSDAFFRSSTRGGGAFFPRLREKLRWLDCRSAARLRFSSSVSTLEFRNATRVSRPVGGRFPLGLARLVKRRCRCFSISSFLLEPGARSEAAGLRRRASRERGGLALPTAALDADRSMRLFSARGASAKGGVSGRLFSHNAASPAGARPRVFG
mmetsp:Transcript_22247/g.56156  ORF Transcript_22247/g.56156 Transcript_22247/m.56156 type:complete len:516 (+) Transcript_22247:888-2435(+)